MRQEDEVKTVILPQHISQVFSCHKASVLVVKLVEGCLQMNNMWIKSTMCANHSKEPDIPECVPLLVSSHYYPFLGPQFKVADPDPTQRPTEGQPRTFCRVSRSWTHQVISIAFSFRALHNFDLRAHAFLHIKRRLHSSGHVQLRLSLVKSVCTSSHPLNTHLLTF